MKDNTKRNLIAYGILIEACLTVALIRAAFPDAFRNGPPAFGLFLSFRGTVVIGLLGLLGIFFLNRTTLRGLWDSDLGANQKLLIPYAAGILFGLANIAMRRFIPIDAALEDFAKSEGIERIDRRLREPFWATSAAES